MPNLLRNILAAITGTLAGGFLNMSLINISGYIIPPPPGTDATTVEGLQKSIHLFGPQHFIMPFLAHALGTLAGAFIATLLAQAAAGKRVSMVIGVLFLSGGVMAVRLIPAPMWFNVTDLVLAYLPMAWAGYYLANLTKARFHG